MKIKRNQLDSRWTATYAPWHRCLPDFVKQYQLATFWINLDSIYRRSSNCLGRIVRCSSKGPYIKLLQRERNRQKGTTVYSLCKM